MCRFFCAGHVPVRVTAPCLACCWQPAQRVAVSGDGSMPFFRGRGQDHEAAGLSASESDESDLEVCHAHHAPTPPHAHRVRAPPSPAHPILPLQAEMRELSRGGLHVQDTPPSSQRRQLASSGSSSDSEPAYDESTPSGVARPDPVSPGSTSGESSDSFAEEASATLRALRSEGTPQPSPARQTAPAAGLASAAAQGGESRARGASRDAGARERRARGAG